MKYSDTLMSKMLAEPVDVWKSNNLYSFIMRIPYLIVVLTFGVLLAIFIDFIVANSGAG